MSRFWSAVVLVLAPSFALGEVCELQVRSDSLEQPRYDLNLVGHHVAILGWQHPSPYISDALRANELLRKASTAADVGHCSDVRDALQQLSLERSDSIQAGRTLSTRIEDVTKDFQPRFYGEEYSPEGFALETKSRRLEANLVDYLAEVCGDPVKQILYNFAFLFPGPETLFQMKHSDLSVVAVEDEKARAFAEASIKKMGELPALNRENLSPETQVFFGMFRDDFLRGKFNVAAASNALQRQSSGSIKSILNLYFRAYRELLDANALRNQRMAETIFLRHEDGVVVIGASHVRDLAEKLKAQCLNSKGASPALSSEPVVTATSSR